MRSLAGASINFLMFGAAVALLWNLSRALAWRRFILLAASLVFLYFCTRGESLLPFVGFLVLGYLGLKIIQAAPGRLTTLLVSITLLVFVWLKRYTFLPPQTFLRFPYAVLGLSYILFRVLHLFEDTSSGAIEEPVGLIAFLTYSLNFTTLVAGPIQRYQEFDKTVREARRLSIVRAGRALERIIVGYFKANVAALVFSTLQAGAVSRVLAGSSPQTRVLSAAVAMAGYAFFLYCNFSGYIDIVVGLAKLMDIRLPENFDRPFSATSFIDFWNRWHITLSTWLKTYVYNPLLMALMRRNPSESLAPVWGVLAFFVTFFLVGAWHGQTSSFLFFGLLQGLGVSVNKVYEILLSKRLGRKAVKALYANRIYNAIARGLTFTWFTFTLLWFWSNWHQLGSFARSIGIVGACETIAIVFVAATIGLGIWETLRNAVVSIQLDGQSVLQSRYTRTAWCTALVLIAIMSELLIRQQAPEIVYKAF